MTVLRLLAEEDGARSAQNRRRETADPSAELARLDSFFGEQTPRLAVLAQKRLALVGTDGQVVRAPLRHDRRIVGRLSEHGAEQQLRRDASVAAPEKARRWREQCERALRRRRGVIAGQIHLVED